jgi:tricorn protease-like protein
VMPRWFCFSTIKNCCADAAKKVTPECAFSAEQDLYRNSILCLQIANDACRTDDETKVDIPDPVPATYNGVKYGTYPRVWISPKTAVSLSDIRDVLTQVKSPKVVLSHDRVYYISPEHLCESILSPSPVALTQNELDSEQTPDNYKVRGYKPAKQ